MLLVVLLGDVCVDIVFVVVDSPVCLHAHCDDASKVEWVGFICSVSVSTIWRPGSELSSIGLE